MLKPYLFSGHFLHHGYGEQIIPFPSRSICGPLQPNVNSLNAFAQLKNNPKISTVLGGGVTTLSGTEGFLRLWLTLVAPFLVVPCCCLASTSDLL